MMIYVVMRGYSDYEGSYRTPLKAFEEKTAAETFELDCEKQLEQIIEITKKHREKTHANFVSKSENWQERYHQLAKEYEQKLKQFIDPFVDASDKSYYEVEEIELVKK